MGAKTADPARIAAQVVSGVGFLGAGMIFVHKNTITGLTTAAGIWTTAGIGMAIGAGMYLTGTLVTMIVVIVQNTQEYRNKRIRYNVSARVWRMVETQGKSGNSQAMETSENNI